MTPPLMNIATIKKMVMLMTLILTSGQYLLRESYRHVPIALPYSENVYGQPTL